jgi:hypothetical protein
MLVSWIGTHVRKKKKKKTQKKKRKKERERLDNRKRIGRCGLESFKRGRHVQLLPYSFLLKFFASSSTTTY